MISNYLFMIAICAGVVSSLVIPDEMLFPSSSTTNPEELGPYFQGDIMLPQNQLSGRVDEKYRWLNGTIHYEFDEKYPLQLQSTFLQAVNHIATRTCIKFLPRNVSTSSSPPPNDYLYVTASVSTSCYSYVGRQGGRQVISLPPPCNGVGTMIHEALHAIGYHHEQSRPDRDEHVKIIWEHVQPGKEPQFMKYDESKVSSFGVEYDYGSVMHYSRNSFSRDRSLDTIVPLVDRLPPGMEMGQRRGMSEKDVEKVNRMYNC